MSSSLSVACSDDVDDGPERTGKYDEKYDGSGSDKAAAAPSEMQRVIVWPAILGEPVAIESAETGTARFAANVEGQGKYIGGLRKDKDAGWVCDGFGKLRFRGSPSTSTDGCPAETAVQEGVFLPEWCAGCFVDGKLDGHGMLKSNQGIYYGSFRCGRMEGPGKFEDLLDGSVMEGTFTNGLPDGFVQCTFANGDSFRGKFQQGIPTGTGAYDLSNGTQYEGQIGPDGAEGLGIMQTGNSSMRYTGEFLKNKPHGKGLQQFSNGDVYKGHFSHGIIQGRGVFQFANDDSCSGSFENGALEGNGAFDFSSGDRYTGEFRAGVMHGKGAMYWIKSNETFHGDFVDGQVRGKGELTRKANSDQAKTLYSLSGTFHQGKPDGEMSVMSPAGGKVAALYNQGVFQKRKQADERQDSHHHHQQQQQQSKADEDKIPSTKAPTIKHKQEQAEWSKQSQEKNEPAKIVTPLKEQHLSAKKEPTDVLKPPLKKNLMSAEEIEQQEFENRRAKQLKRDLRAQQKNFDTVLRTQKMFLQNQQETEMSNQLKEQQRMLQDQMQRQMQQQQEAILAQQILSLGHQQQQRLVGLPKYATHAIPASHQSGVFTSSLNPISYMNMNARLQTQTGFNLQDPQPCSDIGSVQQMPKSDNEVDNMR